MYCNNICVLYDKYAHWDTLEIKYNKTEVKIGGFPLIYIL